MMDGSTLGKIDVRGADAGELLDRLYTNLMSGLKVGSARYGVMCGVDGMVIDDGTVIRLADERFLLTTTTGNAARILDWMEEWVQTEWPELRVYLHFSDRAVGHHRRSSDPARGTSSPRWRRTWTGPTRRSRS